MTYTIRKATADDICLALDLALRVFMKFEAPDYEIGAVDKFKADCIENIDYINNYRTEKHLMLIAFDGDKIIGVINERGNGHISMVFVDDAYHRQGIAIAMMEQMVCELKLRGYDKITINSSPYGLPFYLHFGFVPTDIGQRKDGFIFTPMVYEPNEIWDVLDENRNPTGRFIERSRPWHEGNYHLVVHVWKRNNKGEWLIDKRTVRGTAVGGNSIDGKWETTGGSAIAGDSSPDAALRESKEELGIDLLPENGHLFRSYANRGFKGYTGFVDVWVFNCNCSLDDVVLQESETCDVMWASGEKIKEMVENGEFIGYDVYPYLDDLLERY